MKTVKTKRSLLLRGLSCVALVLCMVLTSFAVVAESPATDTVNIVTVSSNVKAGAKLSENNVTITAVKNVNIPANVAKTIEEVDGMYITENLSKGEYVYTSILSKRKPSTTPKDEDILIKEIATVDGDFVCVTDFFEPNTGYDLQKYINELIEKNPYRTIYFPDGEYLVSKPIITACAGTNTTTNTYAKSGSVPYPGSPKDTHPSLGFEGGTTTILLSDGAVLKADPDKWKASNKSGTSDAVVCLGAKGVIDSDDGKIYYDVNDAFSNGSYFSIIGGTIDGSGVADCLEFTRGRETLARGVRLIDFKGYGLHVAQGTNFNSSDCDIEDIIIIGNGGEGTVGIFINAYDNTISGIRVYNCQTGIHINGVACGSIRDVVVVNNIVGDMYYDTIGINLSENNINFYSNCYVENYEKAYVGSGASSYYDACIAAWTEDASGLPQTAFSNGRRTNCIERYYERGN